MSTLSKISKISEILRSARPKGRLKEELLRAKESGERGVNVDEREEERGMSLILRDLMRVVCGGFGSGSGKMDWMSSGITRTSGAVPTEAVKTGIGVELNVSLLFDVFVM